MSLFWVLCACCSNLIWAEDFEDVTLTAIDPLLEQQGWSLLSKKSVSPTHFSLREGAIRVQAIDSNALIYRELTDEEQHAAYLNWSWKVDSAPPATSLKKVDNDDRAIAVYVGYAVHPKHLGWWTRFKRSVVSRFTGLPKGQVLTYIWGGNDDTEIWYPNPYIKRIGKMMILQTADAPTEQWHQVSVPLPDHFENAFGYPPEAALYLAISADTEDSAASALSWIKDIQFSDEPVYTPVIPKPDSPLNGPKEK